MKSKLLLTGRDLNRDYRIANRDEAEGVVNRVNNGLIPIRSGGLRDSANILGTGSNGVQSVMTISYSGPHAIPIHELPLFNPPTWDGTNVHFTVGGPKFLEKGLRERSAGMLERIATRVRF